MHLYKEVLIKLKMNNKDSREDELLKRKINYQRMVQADSQQFKIPTIKHKLQEVSHQAIKKILICLHKLYTIKIIKLLEIF